MKSIFLTLNLIFLTILTSCAPAPFEYVGPEVTRIVVMKDARKLYLMNNEEILKSYDVALGFTPEGAKTHEGDGKTPEGRYRIDRRNPNSNFHLSLGISYPNQDDVANALALGQAPGSDIFIHGDRRPNDPEGPDWTAGCIAVTNQEIAEIYSMVAIDTVIDIYP